MTYHSIRKRYSFWRQTMRGYDTDEKQHQLARANAIVTIGNTTDSKLLFHIRRFGVCHDFRLVRQRSTLPL
jgi:hypothetical protein